MTIINETTVVVFSSEELKNCLEGNNGYAIIYLGANITLGSGINISSSKQSIIIDGTYEGITYQLEDRKSSTTGDTIRVSAAYPNKVVVQNMNIIGYNYYGVIFVPEASTYQNTVIEYNNITYVGPQISFHPYGLTRFINCNITIADNYSTGNEVAECNKIEIGGQTTITHKSSGNSSFWFRNATPSLTILSNANLNFSSEKRELFYGVSNLKLTILKGATFNIVTT